MAVLRIDLVIALAVRFGQFFQGRPRFVVLPDQELLRRQEQRVFRPEMLAEMKFQPQVTEILQGQAPDFPIRVQADEAGIDPLDEELIDAGKGRRMEEEFQRQLAQDVLGVELAGGLSR